MFRDSFYGKTISDYGRQNGRVDYRTLASTFDAVLCNRILGYREGFEDWEQIHGFVDNSEEIERKTEELEEATEALEKAEKAKDEAESNFEDYGRASESIAELLERFDNFEYEANELLECLKWNNFETPNGYDFDGDIIEDNVNYLDLWGMREAIESYQSTVSELFEEAETKAEETETEFNKLTKRKEDLEAEIEELEEEDSTETEYYQYYIISDSGYQILSENTNEAIWYNEELDLYVWGVTHWGTSWDYVLTEIPCETYEEQREREEAERFETEVSESLERDPDLGELLELWDTDITAEEIEQFNRDTELLEMLEELEEVEEIDVGTLEQIDWRVATVGDIVIGSSLANCYGCTTEGWKGEIVSLDTFEGDNPMNFTARTIEGGKNTHKGETFARLNTEAFEVFASEGGEA